mgnify:CR=1 FL=1
MKKFIRIMAIIAGLALFAACGKDGGSSTEPSGTGGSTGGTTGGSTGGGSTGGGTGQTGRTDFVFGSDVSWVTEMEKDGKKFYDSDGTQKDLFQMFKSLGQSVIRLRVWVNPDGGWCAYDDVYAKAKRAQDAGMSVMLDFHYSDFFADPNTQTPPAAWNGKTHAELVTLVGRHTAEFLTKLKLDGINPTYIQIGNETRNGMLWPDGQLWNDKGDISGGWTRYIELSNAGYDAAKGVFSGAQVFVHLNHAYEDNVWWFVKFMAGGGKTDVIGLSHYPQTDKTGASYATVNSEALANIANLASKTTKDIIVVETGGAFTLSGGRLQNASANETALAGALTLNGGTADITGGVIYNAGAAYETEETGVSVYQNGTLNLSGSPAISGGIYLAQNETYVNVPAAFSPANAVLLIPNHSFDGRDLARYDASLGVPGEPEKLHWTLPAEILLTYGVNNDADDPQMLELQLKGAVYIDGVNGNDTRDGATPETAVKTLKRAYTLLSGLDGSTLYVVDTVTLSASAILDHGWYLSGTDEIDAGGDVQFIRYSQPSDYNAGDPGELTGFGKPSCTGALLEVPVGLSLAVNGVTFDGHSYAVTDSVPRYNAPGVEAAAALLLVNEGGTADLSDHTILQNNANVSEDGEGKGGAIANYGTVLMGGVTVINNSALYGQGVYQSGTLKVNGTAHPTVAADQQIHLTGLQGAEDERLITVTGALDEGFAFTVNFDDPVLGRNVAQFATGAFIETVDGEKNHFVLAPGIEYTIVKSNDPAEPDTLELGKGYSLTIFKYADMTDLKEPNKTFLFEVTDVTPGAETNGTTYYVYIGTYTDAVTGETVPAWVDNAYSCVSVTGLPEGVYTVRELTDWSWRYEVTDAWGADDEHYSVSDDFVVTVTLDGSRTVYFRNTLTNPDYVNGYARSYSNTFCP